MYVLIVMTQIEHRAEALYNFLRQEMLASNPWVETHDHPSLADLTPVTWATEGLLVITGPWSTGGLLVITGPWATGGLWASS